MAARITTFLGSIVLSSRAEAATIFERFEYHSFWSDALPIILMVALAIGATIFLRRRIRQQQASAPADSRRNERQRAFHRLSLLFIVAPLLYGYILDVDLVFPILAILTAQPVLMSASRPLKSRFGLRMLCILPVAVIAWAIGELVRTWPRPDLSLAQPEDWVLVSSSASFAIGWLLSFVSFPAAYRVRAW